MKYYFIVISGFALATCTPRPSGYKLVPNGYEDSVAVSMDWKPIRDNLYLSRFGDVGFKTMYHTSGLEVTETYKTNFPGIGDKPFKNVIDIETFRKIGGDWGWGGYFKDKNHIYHFFGNSDGGNLSIVEEADHATFEIISDCYARDKNHIYDMRFGALDNVSSNGFIILDYKERCLGKYNGIYYEGYQKLSPEELIDPEMQEIIKQFDKL